MTEKLFYENQYLTEFDADVISCTRTDSGYETVLDKTAFFPLGGGQPGDIGEINDASVLDTYEKDDLLIHLTDKPLSGKVHGRINRNNRFCNMQRHSGEQIFSGWVHKMLGYENVGFHMGTDEVTVDFDGPIDSDTLTEIENNTNKTIYDNIAIETLLPSRDELCNYEYRSKKELFGQVRLVKIGDIDLCACCGTHVARTGEVGIVKVIDCMNYKGGVRVTLVIGSKALEDYRKRCGQISAISASLCAKPFEVSQSVEKLKAKLADEHEKLTDAKRKYYDLVCETATGFIKVVFDSDCSAHDASVFADKLKKKVGIAAVFAGDDSQGYKYAIASQTTDPAAVAKRLNEALGGRGGGRGELISGSVMAKQTDIMNFWNSVTED